MILFGRPIRKSDSEDTMLASVVEVLVRHDPLLSLAPSQRNGDYTPIFKVIYQHGSSEKKRPNLTLAGS